MTSNVRLFHKTKITIYKNTYFFLLTLFLPLDDAGYRQLQKFLRNLFGLNCVIRVGAWANEEHPNAGSDSLSDDVTWAGIKPTSKRAETANCMLYGLDHRTWQFIKLMIMIGK